MDMSQGDAIKRNIVSAAKQVNAFIDQLLVDRKPPILYEAGRHLINAGGKRLRPYLTLKACEAVGGRAEDAMPFAAALELLHNFTLVHDDVMDNDMLRRGSPTVHAKYGESMAILAGDLLFAKVYQTVLDHAPTSISKADVVRALKKVTDATVMLCEGQALDISFPKATDVTEDDYLFMVSGKTSALFKACAEVGAIVGGGSEEQVKALGAFAWDAGLAFQIVDDVLGVTADEETLGKPVGSDIREGKKTLIMIHALKHASPGQLEVLGRAMTGEKATHGEIDAAVDVFKELGSIDYASGEADKYLNRALESISVIPDNGAKGELVALLHYFVQRKY